MADAWSAARYARNARFVSDLGAEALDWLAPAASERILDLGCGDGALTLRIMEAGAQVLGVDSSPDMVAAAQARGVDARVADAQALRIEGPFDAVFSNAALHWMTRPDAVIAGVRRALRPGGRFVAEFGGHGNVAAIRTALDAVLAHRFGVPDACADVWYFPSVAEHRARLEAAGFVVSRIALIPRPTPIPSDMSGWLATLAAPVLAKLPEARRAEARDAVQTLLAPALRDAEGRWTADYVRLRFAASLQESGANAAA